VSIHTWPISSEPAAVLFAVAPPAAAIGNLLYRRPFDSDYAAIQSRSRRRPDDVNTNAAVPAKIVKVCLRRTVNGL
jgi:hypothetical protein